MYRIRIPYSELLIKTAFFLFFFFTFFPMSEPFPSKRQETGIENISETNPINQLIKLTVFILTTLSSIYKFNEIINFIKREKFLALFLVWALLSMFWSDFPFVTFKRWFQIFLIYFVIITFLTYFSEKEVLKILKIVIYPYLALTFIAVLLVPDAKDPAFNTWRGIAATKNNLGQIGVISATLSLIVYSNESISGKKNIAVLFFILSVIIVIGTLSSTSYIALFIFLTGSILYYVKTKIFGRLGVTNSLFIYSFATGILLLITLMLFIPDFTDTIQSIFGKSETFYDRGKLWKVMLLHISQHPLIGCGFQAFWTLENPQLLLLYQTFVWLPNQAHNGYLDMINEIGIIGLILFLIIILRYFVVIIKRRELSLWAWFFILPLISSVTESILFRTSDIYTRMLFLSYLFLFMPQKSK